MLSTPMRGVLRCHRAPTSCYEIDSLASLPCPVRASPVCAYALNVFEGFPWPTRVCFALAACPRNVILCNQADRWLVPGKSLPTLSFWSGVVPMVWNFCLACSGVCHASPADCHCRRRFQLRHAFGVLLISHGASISQPVCKVGFEEAHA